MEPHLLAETYTCRPDKSSLVPAAFIGVIGLLPFVLLIGHPNSLSLLVMLAIYSSLFVVPAVLGAIWVLRAQIIAERDVLRWRGLGGWHVARWDQVSDFYQKNPVPAKKIHRYVVETPSGKMVFGTSHWSKGEGLLRSVIAERAIAASSHQWKVWGTRPDADWPLTFTYRSVDRRTLTICSVGLVLCLAEYVSLAAPKIKADFRQMGSGWGAGSIAMVGFMLLPILLIALLTFKQVWDTKKRKNQTITVRSQGLLYEDDLHRVQADWDQITELYVSSRGTSIRPKYIVVTQNGTFEFTSVLKDAAVLADIIEDHAGAATATQWSALEPDVLGGSAARWSSGCEGVGARIYHYRTRSLRAVLFFPTAIALTPLLLLLLSEFGLAHRPSWTEIMIQAAALTWMWWRYFAAHVQTDTNGITQFTPFGRRYLRWEQVDRFWMSGSDAFQYINVSGAGTKIQLWFGIGDAAELKAEIAQRAVNSQNRAWDSVKIRTRTRKGQKQG